MVIEKSFAPSRTAMDGVTVGKEIRLVDQLENMGSQLMREVAQKTNALAGDGTGPATELAHGILREGAGSR